MRSLRPPSQPGSTLALPPAADWLDLLAKNRVLASSSSITIGGMPLVVFRNLARRQALGTATEFLSEFDQSLGRSVLVEVDRPLVVTGHQPELFHPGVWIKNFAACGLARTAGGVGLHVLADNDVVAQTAIRVPAGSAEAPYLALVPFDRLEGEVPFEERGVVDDAIFADFADRVIEEMRLLPFRPIMRRYWNQVRADGWKKRRLGERFAAARRALEADFGCRNLEVPLSRLCQQSAFALFTADILDRIEDFVPCHNQALSEYRKRNRIRSRHHPVPALQLDGQWHEAPFWVWSAAEPTRRRLFVRRDFNQVALRADDLDLAAIRAARGELGKLADWLLGGLGGWKVRPRALMTTMFLRLAVADLFIHGIGGGKYDELTDEIARGFFGQPSPDFAILTGTAVLPIGTDPLPADSLPQAARRRRDLTWNPDRYLDPALSDQDPIADWIERKYALRDAEPSNRSARRERFRELRELNERLRRYLGDLPAQADRRIADLSARRDADLIRQSREFAFCLHPEESLRRLFEPWLRF